MQADISSSPFHSNKVENYNIFAANPDECYWTKAIYCHL